MVNLVAPTAIIFIDNNLTDAVKTVIQKQLFINETITGTEFDARVSIDPNYVNDIHNNQLRILVVRPLTELTNRGLADIVLSAKAGLIAIKQSKYGPPGKTLPIERVYLSQLLNAV